MNNQLNIIGHLGQDAVTREGSKSSFTTFSVAVNTTWKDKTGKPKTTWFSAIVNGRLASVAAQLRKGDKVQLSGEFLSKEYVKDGVTHNGYQLHVNELQKLDKPQVQDEGESESSSSAATNDADSCPF